ncbi:MAG: FkbM family methyltransferase [Rhodocyclales bacterium]|nr:FkbM family methyltransferase [Rhodocyclales bacterium]
MWSLFQLLDDDCVLDILDVGASLIHAPPYAKLVAANRARLVGFEPDPVECEKLNGHFGGAHRFYPFFIGDGNEATYHQTNWVATGSLFEPDTPLLEKFANLAEVVTPEAQIRVATTRLDDIADLGDIDFFKIDVQGSELNIFRNARSVLEQTLVIQTEVSFVELYKDLPLFSDVDAFLRANGFRYHRIDGFGTRPFRSPSAPVLMGNRQQQLWCDAIYVKDWMRLDRISPPKLRKYAAIVHDLFDSYDLAQAVLLEHDRQTGQNLAERYARRFGITAQEAAPQPGPSAGREDEMLIESGAGPVYSAPATLACISTYVLLEQERWFEIEADFLDRYLADGMTVIDIGANIGLYAVPMARAVGVNGRVFAYEPGTDNRHHLERNIELNGLGNVDVSSCALSNYVGTASLNINVSGELNSIVAGDADPSTTESVKVSTLDAEMERAQWTSVDFVKIDAEGQEARIVAGSRRFLHDFSPLVMYEVKHGSDSSGEHLRWTFEALGYQTYRAIGDGSMLVPVASDERLDAYQLNLFAAKPDRAQKLAAAGLLALSIGSHALDDSERAKALAAMLDQPYARSFEMTLDDIEPCPYVEALAGYAAYRFLDGLAPDRRLALLEAALRQLNQFCQANANPAALATLARVANDLGSRQVAIAALSQIAQMSGIAIDQPFFPASRRFESVDPGDTPELWFKAAACEQLEFSRAYSSLFESGASPLESLKWMCDGTYASGEILRRTILVGIASGLPGRDIDAYLEMLRRTQTRNLAVWQLSAGKLHALRNT